MAVRDTQRIEHMQTLLAEQDMDAIFCTWPSNVLMLSGYYPVMGTAAAIFTKSGESFVIAPEDERSFTESGWADEVDYYEPASLDDLAPIQATLAKAVGQLVVRHNLSSSRFGTESGSGAHPVSYVSVVSMDGEMVLREAIPKGPVVRSLDGQLTKAKSVKSSMEIERIRTAAGVAMGAYRAARISIQPGKTEKEVAEEFSRFLSICATEESGATRAGGKMFCMSGPNGASAFAAYQHSTDRTLQDGDSILIHCNSYVDGFWTDITRSYVLGDSPEHTDRLKTIEVAQRAAFDAIRPHAKARAVDQAARKVLESDGYGKQFKHPTGHGVGFEATNHNARPRIHPKSEDILEPGMVFNVEPGIYIDGCCGFRKCDMVAVTSSGYDLLTP